MRQHAVTLGATVITFILTPATAQSNAQPSMPATSDDASSNQGASHTTSLVNYYFVFLALFVCMAGLAGFFMYRRKKKYGMIIRQSREGALQRDLNTWDPIRARRRYWQGRWRSTDHTREEGLNELGEAPPPYMPKSSMDNHNQPYGATEPSVPLQTLSREQAGLKLPDYTAAHVRPISNDDDAAEELQRPRYAQHGPGYDSPATPQDIRHG